MLKRDIAVVLVSVFGLWLATRSGNGPSAVRFRKAWHSGAMLDSALVPPDEDGSSSANGNGNGNGNTAADPSLLADPSSPAARASAAASALREALSRTQLHAHLPKPVVADLNGDGSLEVLVATHDFGLRLLRPEPPSAFSSREGFAPAREVAAASLLPTINDKEYQEFDEEDWAPAALAVGFLDPQPQALVSAPRKMVAAVVTRGWRVMVFDHNLRRLWTAAPARDAARSLGEGAALHEVALAVLPSPVRRGDRGLVVVGGSAMRMPAESESHGHGVEGLLEAEARREEVDQAHFKGVGVGGGGLAKEEKKKGGGDDTKKTAAKPTTAAPIDLTRHFSYFAYEGGRGQLRWTHEQTDPLPPGEDRLGGPGAASHDEADDDAGPLTAQHTFRLSAADLSSSSHRNHHHHPYYSFGGGSSNNQHNGLAADPNDPPSCRDFRESALHALPHSWLTTADTRLEAALFVRHGDGRLLDGPDHEHPEYAYDSWMGGPTPQQKRRAAAGLRGNKEGAGKGGGGGVAGWASRLLFGGHSAASSSSSSSSSQSLVGNDEAFFSQGTGARAAGNAQGRATVTTDAHAGAAARHAGGAGTASTLGGGRSGLTSSSNQRALYRPNALVAHVEGGIEVMHLYSGRPVCRMTLPPGHVVHADLNGDGVVERVASPPGALSFEGEEGGFAHSGGGLLPGHAASSGPCVASATTGAPNRRLLWRLDLCAMRHPTLEAGGAWLERQETEGVIGARGHGSSGGAPAPAAFAAPAFLPLPRAGDGAYSRLRGQHGLVAFFGSDGVVTGVSARGETLFVEHTGCTWGAPWGADDEEEEGGEEEEETEEAIEARLRKEMGVGGEEEEGGGGVDGAKATTIDPAHRSFVSTYHDELEREAKKEKSQRRKMRQQHREMAIAAAEKAQLEGSLYQEPENLDEFAPAVPTLAALPLRTGAVPTALLALGARQGVILSERGHELDRFHLPHPPAQAAVLEDFDGDGLTDLIVVTGNGVYGYAQRHASGGLALGSLLAALMVALALVWWGSVAPPLVGGFGGLVVSAGGAVGGVNTSSGASARAAARAMRQAALKARRSTHWED